MEYWTDINQIDSFDGHTVLLYFIQKNLIQSYLKVVIDLNVATKIKENETFHLHLWFSYHKIWHSKYEQGKWIKKCVSINVMIRNKIVFKSFNLCTN